MYLSCLLINVGDNPDHPRPGRLWLRNLYHVHQRLCMAFPSASRKADDPDFLRPFKPEDFGPQQVHVARGADAGFLFRIDPRPGGRVVVLVQSALRPDWDYAFRNGACLLAAPPDVKSYDPSFEKEQHVRFRLRANPTVRRVFEPASSGQPKQSGKRVGVYGEEAQREWLDRKAERAGFRVLDCRVLDRGFQVSGRRNGAPPLRHLCVDFEGILELTDPETFLSALESGIGSGKAFGFGLLSVARA